MPTLTPEQEADYRRLIDGFILGTRHFGNPSFGQAAVAHAVCESRRDGDLALAAVLAYVAVAHRRGLIVPLLRGVEQIVASLDPDLPVEHDPYPPSEN